MNNNGFAIMRYFRDLGVDAFLLPYLTDGTENLAHFATEMDTWYVKRWAPYIKPLNLPNSTKAVFGQLRGFKLPPTRRKIEKIFANYNYFIGSGIAPILFERIGWKLDIFFPYGTGIEFYGDIEFYRKKKSLTLSSLVYQSLRKLQASGIQHSKYCLNAELSITKDSFDEIGKPFKCIAIPMVYNREDTNGINIPERISSVVERIQSAEIGIFCCSRLLWVRDPSFSKNDWRSLTKNSDWLFHGLKEFVRQHPAAKPLLAIVEYGPDVDATKQLVAKLKLQSYVLWLPIMPRREIMLLLSNSDLGVGEFYTDPGVIFGGTGWEVLASGKPLLQSFNFTADSFENEFDQPPPPILDVKSPDDVTRHLSEMYHNPELRKSIGGSSVDWFNKYNGIGLAKQWLDLLLDNEKPVK
jgi:hypothetical protein